jgi:hypothetical protein
MATSFDEQIDELQRLLQLAGADPTKWPTVDDLIALANQVDIGVGGQNALLYSGGFGSGASAISAGELADRIGKQLGSSVISDTDRGRSPDCQMQ